MGTKLFIKAFFKRIIDDFNQRELLPLKLLFFVHASTLFVLYPYLTIHMRELGINVEETAIMSAVTPIVGIIMPPLAGMVADRIGNFKILLAIFSSLGGASALLLLLVPVGRVTIMYPADTLLSMGCAGSSMFLDQADPYPCNPGNSSVFVNMSVRSCGFVCQPPSGMVLFPDEIHNYTVEVSGAKVGDPSSYGYTLAPKVSLPQGHQVDEDVRAHRSLHLNERFGSSVRNISHDYFFPAPEHLSHYCEEGSCHFVHEMFHDTHTFFNVKNVSVHLRRKAKELFMDRIGATNDSLYNATCTDQFTQDGSQVRILLPRPGDTPVVFPSCVRRCLVTVPRKIVCKETDIKHELDVSLTFWLYMAIRVFLGMIGGTAFAMFEGAIIAILREQKADYGLQRIYASIGGMISSPLSGLLIDYASQGKGYTDFRPAFYLYAGLKIASGLLILTINLEFKTPAKNVISDVVKVLKNIELIALLVIIFVLGSAWGFIENFLFWLLQDLGGKSSLMGITITVGGVAGIPLLVLSGPIIDKIGHANVLFIGFVFYAIRLLGYSLIYNPWHCLFFEAMESVTTSLSFTAAVTYAAKLSTTTTDSSIQGLLGGLYFGVGKGTGSLVGGYLMKAIGTRHTYQVFSAMCAVVGSTYFFINKFYLRKRPQTEGNDIIKVKTKFMDKGLKKNKKALETAPINDEVSKTYSSNDVANGKDVVKTTPVECNVNLGYEETGDSAGPKDTRKKADADGGVDNPAVELEDVVADKDESAKDKDQVDSCK